MNTQKALRFACVAMVSMKAFSAVALDLPKLSGVRVESSATRDKRSGFYTYRYQMDYRGPGSLEVEGLSVDLRSDSSRQVLSAPGLLNYSAEQVSASTLQYVEALGPGGIVPIGFPTVPKDWVVGINPFGTVLWTPVTDAARPRAGTTIGGFTVMSPALPGLRSAKVIPELTNAISNPDDPSTEPYSRDELFAAIDASSQVLTTIGPVAPPKVFDPLSFAEQIRDLVRQSQTLGWIRSDHLEDALDRLLDRMEADMKHGHVREALESGRAFLDVLEDASCKEHDCDDKVAATSEANALLRFNMEYLLAQLQPASGKNHGDDTDKDKTPHP
jgi:hypothetical protein